MQQFSDNYRFHAIQEGLLIIKALNCPNCKAPIRAIPPCNCDYCDACLVVVNDYSEIAVQGDVDPVISRLQALAAAAPLISTAMCIDALMAAKRVQMIGQRSRSVGLPSGFRWTSYFGRD